MRIGLLLTLLPLSACTGRTLPTPTKPFGAACSTNAECWQACIGGTCAALASTGGACDEPEDCASDEHLCFDTVCLGAAGSACSNNDDCAGVCIVGSCAQASGRGAACDESRDCQAGLSCAAGVCAPCGDGCVIADSAPCHTGIIDCSAAAICAAHLPLADNTACGATGTCNAGMCDQTRQALIAVPEAGASAGNVGYDVAVDGRRVVVGVLSEYSAAPGKAFILEGDPLQAVAELVPIELDPLSNMTRYGTTVVLEGDRAVVCARTAEDDFGNFGGAVFIFERDADGTWGQVARVSAPPNPPGTWSNFGTSLDLDGDRLIVGAPFDEAGSGDPTEDSWAGAGYIVDRSPAGDWSVVARLTAPGGDSLGHSVALDGDRAVVGGMWDENFEGESTGGGYVYERQGDGTWLHVASLFPSIELNPYGAGQEIALRGDTVVLGSPFSSPPPTEDRGVGLVTVFGRQPDGSWIQTAVLRMPTPLRDARFGSGMIMDGDRIFASAVDWNTSEALVTVFHAQPDGAWLLTGMLRDPDGANYSGEGWSGIEVDLQIGVSGSLLLVGIPGRGTLTRYDVSGL